MVSMISVITACCSNQGVTVAKEVDRSVAYPQKIEKQAEVPMNLPSSVTAICRDGSYSTATNAMCAGNGGVQTIISHHHAD
ncbi:hypothetical protein A6B43_06470 [Vespertiliibacter pulmonis]|nr:hypothetical protein A6B43_06470 [Vespertiliibacter pulmonis]